MVDPERVPLTMANKMLYVAGLGLSFVVLRFQAHAILPAPNGLGDRGGVCALCVRWSGMGLRRLVAEDPSVDERVTGANKTVGGDCGM